ncbi:MAG: HAD-IIIA family hydrolase [Pseudomonadota bacterium]
MARLVTDPAAGDALASLQLVVFDVDGVMTDGRFSLDDQGAETKTFHTQDGYGLRLLLEAGLEIAIVTGRQSGAVSARMAELGIAHVYQGARHKAAVLTQLLAAVGVQPGKAAAVGDDVPDVDLFAGVGTGIAVANATPPVLAAADWVTTRRGGHGAVREIADAILAARQAAAVR